MSGNRVNANQTCISVHGYTSVRSSATSLRSEEGAELSSNLAMHWIAAWRWLRPAQQCYRLVL